eukprot:gene1423-15844_t
MANKAELESLEKKIQGKTRLLEFISVETNEILSRKDKVSIDRQLGIYEKKITEIHDLKCEVQELKLEDEVEPTEKLFAQEAEFEQAKFEERIKQERKLEEIKQEPKSSTSVGGEVSSKRVMKELSIFLSQLMANQVNVINAYVQNLTSLPVIKGANSSKVHDFHAKLLISVQALESMGKLSEVNGFARATLDKLEGIKSDLVRTDDSWQNWGFPQLVDALRRWTERNPIPLDDRGAGPNFTEMNKPRFNKQEKMFQAKQYDFKSRPCVYCEETGHKSYECNKVQEVEKRRDILRQKIL